MRNRILRPGFFKNETLAELPPLTRILFQGLWLIADKEGFVEDRPKRIKAEILPYDEIDVSVALDELESSGFVIRMICQDGIKVIKVVKFTKYQKIHHKEAESIFKTPTLPPTDPQPAPNQPPTDRSTSTSTFTNTSTFKGSTSEQANPGENQPTKTTDIRAGEMCRLLAQGMVDNDPKARLPKTEQQKARWIGDMEKIHRLDERDWLVIRSVIIWCQADGFWRGNILSPGKLRKQFPALVLAMKRPAGGSGSRAEENKQAMNQVLEEMRNGTNNQGADGLIGDLQRTDGTGQDQGIPGGPRRIGTG